MIIVPGFAFIVAVAASIVNIYDGLRSATTTVDAGGSWNFLDARLAGGTRSFAGPDMAYNTRAASRSVNRTVVPSVMSFSPTADGAGLVDIGGDRYWVETAGKSYSLTNPDPQTLRFEIQAGDKASYDYANGAACDRSQIDGSAGGHMPVGTPVNINYQFMLEPNGPNGSFTNTARWFVTGEMQSTAYGASPPFAIELKGDHLQVVARYVRPGGNPSNGSSDLKMLTLWTDPNPIQTGQYHNIQIQTNVSNNSSGYLQVSVNGTRVVSYQGPLGYGAPTYWMYGLYRSPTSETVAAKFRNMTLTTGADSSSGK
ncbi:hypothetical protein V1279_001949 [Bradyrhizobium sp. AZCC 1610]|uniref:heparin lyase I family protein n=1 Tax=Bradyrhizobium sp. AZCC 1610 TaxID=3117020 RepID=UPI002FF13B08